MGMPGQPGAWPLKACVQFAVSLREDDGPIKQQLALAELDLKQEQAREKRRENEIAEANLLQKADVELWAATALIEMREAMMAVPDALANSVEPAQREFVREETDRRIRNGLRQFKARMDEHSNAGSDTTLASG